MRDLIKTHQSIQKLRLFSVMTNIKFVYYTFLATSTYIIFSLLTRKRSLSMSSIFNNSQHNLFADSNSEIAMSIYRSHCKKICSSFSIYIFIYSTQICTWYCNHYSRSWGQQGQTRIFYHQHMLTSVWHLLGRWLREIHNNLSGPHNRCQM